MQKPPIFYDPSGRRWRYTRIIALSLALLVAGTLLFVGPRTLASPRPADYDQMSSGAPSALTAARTDESAFIDSLRRHNVPVIGSGPLVRLVKVDGASITSIGSGPAKVISSEADLLAVKDQKYAIERYGATNGKRIVLTFDDGPDPKYSPKILDVLSQNDMPSSFFVVGTNVIKHDEIANRMVREGHVLANHSFSHANFDLISEPAAEQEIIRTQRAIRSTTGYETAFFRIPYGGDNDQSMRDNLRAIYEAQKLGYVVTSYDFDTNDWDKTKNQNIPLPDLSGNGDIVMLLHDSGGDRTKTIEYLKQLSTAAKSAGYTFANLNQVYPREKPLFAPAAVTLEDNAFELAAKSVFVWPFDIVMSLFLVTIISIVAGVFGNTIFAILEQRRRQHFKRRPKTFKPFVSVLVPAFNESDVLQKTVSSILKSRYKNLEIVIIDDGSTDGTFKLAKRLAGRSKRVRAYRQKNGGKSRALNNALKRAKGDIVVSVDADTVFPAYTIGRLIRHFHDPRVGAVAGTVKVGNITNILARWQALEYTVSIFLERAAQAYLNAIIIVPGACGAWRKEAILAAGGYSSDTLAEDCDLTLAVRRAGYRIVQDNSAEGFTEVPSDMATLAKQRYRWIFGNMQSFWKHRSIAFNRNYGWLGMVIMPYAMFNIITPILFIPLLVGLAVSNIINEQFLLILGYIVLVLALQLITGSIAVLLARERRSLLLAIPITRFVYGPLKTYLLYKSVATILRGSQVSWNKFQRTNSVTIADVFKRTATN